MYKPFQNIQEKQAKKGMLRVFRMYLKQKGRPYTGLALIPFIEKGLVSEDHVIPRSKNGDDDPGNLVLVPSWVNSMKADMNAKDFVQYLKDSKLPYKKNLKDYLL
jgi:CRISPR/Cas system Type II protein with McrA/HNH and RuvC-like nuclease domain